MLQHDFWRYSGLVFWTLLALYLIIRAIYGKNWPWKVGSTLFLGSGLKVAAKQLVKEVRSGEIKDETITEFGVHVFWRLTRIGIIGLVIAGLPIWLLMQQNGLLRNQNKLFALQNTLITSQNEKIDSQLVLFDYQNRLIDRQTTLLDTQTNLFAAQNDLVFDQNHKINTQTGLFRVQNALFQRQNEMVDTQNYRIALQNNLLEADRRSSLVFLMSNVLDKVDEEIKEQRDSIRRTDSIVNLDNAKFRLSKPLINRVVALSRAFRPYQFLERDNLTDKLLSPERGQLFVALMGGDVLDSLTQNTIAEEGDFSNAFVSDFSIPGAHLNNIRFANAYLRGADLSGTRLRGAMCVKTDFGSANLSKADLSGAFLGDADLRYVNLTEANLSNAILIGADLRFARINGANLTGTQLHNCLVSVDTWQAEINANSIVGARDIVRNYKITNMIHPTTNELVYVILKKQ